MTLVKSNMLELGTQAPDFFLFDIVTEKNWSLDDIIGSEPKPVLIVFMCNHCPYVKHVEEEIARIGQTYTDRLAMCAISANDVSFQPDDNPDQLKEQAQRLGFNFPYFYDDRQEIAKSYKAMCTPDFFLFNKDKKLVYRGQLDDSRPSNNEPVDGHSLREAIDQTLIEQEVTVEQKPSFGCSIKWRPGNEPDYFTE